MFDSPAPEGDGIGIEIDRTGEVGTIIMHKHGAVSVIAVVPSLTRRISVGLGVQAKHGRQGSNQGNEQNGTRRQRRSYPRRLL